MIGQPWWRDGRCMAWLFIIVMAANWISYSRMANRIVKVEVQMRHVSSQVADLTAVKR
ncbi:MAG: hypothetical protein ABFE13_11390 [Phycisphaerales bacterium]